MNPMMRRLFQTLRDGLMIVSRDGVLRYANEQAGRLVPCTVGQAVANPVIARRVAAVEAGHLVLPHSERLVLEGGGRLDADTVELHLMASPVGSDCVVVLHNQSERQFFETAVNNLGRMVDRECRQPLEEFLAHAAEVLAQLEDGAQADAARMQLAIARTRASGETLVGLFAKLAALAQLSNGAALQADERIVVQDWLGTVVDAMRPRAADQAVGLALERVAADVPALYGSRLWLARALQECLENAIRHGAPRSEVLVDVSAGGGFVRIRVRNLGLAGVPAHLRGRLMQPLYRGAAAVSSGLPGLGLGLPLVQQIVQLHGGNFSLREDLDGLVEATVELPAGAPAAAPGTNDLAQAQRYARDLARLIERKTIESARSL
jgi:signal transduction histidine kinase